MGKVTVSSKPLCSPHSTQQGTLACRFLSQAHFVTLLVTVGTPWTDMDTPRGRARACPLCPSAAWHTQVVWVMKSTWGWGRGCCLASRARPLCRQPWGATRARRGVTLSLSFLGTSPARARGWGTLWLASPQHHVPAWETGPRLCLGPRGANSWRQRGHLCPPKETQTRSVGLGTSWVAALALSPRSWHPGVHSCGRALLRASERHPRGGGIVPKGKLGR